MTETLPEKIIRLDCIALGEESDEDISAESIYFDTLQARDELIEELQEELKIRPPFICLFVADIMDIAKKEDINITIEQAKVFLHKHKNKLENDMRHKGRESITFELRRNSNAK